MALYTKGISLHLGPKGRGAPDSIRETINSHLGPGSKWVASQQIADPDAVGRMIEAGRGSARSAAVLEYDYLVESAEIDPWTPGGRREDNRQALLAMLRAGWRVRADRLSHLQHANLIISRPDGEAGSVVLTSANLSSGSIDDHLNWAVSSDADEHIAACVQAFEDAADGDFSQIQLSAPETDDLAGLTLSSTGGTLAELTEMVADAERTIDFAYFNVSSGSDLVSALADAAGRGVAVRGVVDGDQAGQSWDAVGPLRSKGIDVRYYPGQLTGARGRMHYKIATVDGSRVQVGTANLSAAAQSSLEVSVTVSGVPDVARIVGGELTRLHRAAATAPIAR